MSSGAASRRGPPKHQNTTAWKPNKGVKKKDKELGGKMHPYPAITGVCARCKDKIEWRRRYGKYKALVEPAKCQQCGKRVIRQAYHKFCSACAKEKNACAKCCQSNLPVVGRNAEEEANERRQLEQALGSLRERDKRTLLRAMEKGSSKSLPKTPRKDEQGEDQDPSSDTGDEDDDDDGDSEPSGTESE
ncbi:uncharacterized protein C9orf85 homolog isoform X2 [Selaginella moellendorffii]|uniref:uncharacterized protein C9orf85 homolog isoform X2 n=1 Tax=Selaginella moellendorffii TaxID=88036 RepID=UPI000D1D0733|nr:uncharacterized protein C9orf85 homolog isoform X2 [Selaginella moellendorffii]|eukprot:XP_024541180.1 uncharacterized protein C9orf85 homolog isoform X2 [Selaginella moellendorffii]